VIDSQPCASYGEGLIVMAVDWRNTLETLLPQFEAYAAKQLALITYWSKSQITSATR
jgi:hypothetical protein